MENLPTLSFSCMLISFPFWGTGLIVWYLDFCAACPDEIAFAWPAFAKFLILCSLMVTLLLILGKNLE